MRERLDLLKQEGGKGADPGAMHKRLEDGLKRGDLASPKGLDAAWAILSTCLHWAEVAR